MASRRTIETGDGFEISVRAGSLSGYVRRDEETYRLVGHLTHPPTVARGARLEAILQHILARVAGFREVRRIEQPILVGAAHRAVELQAEVALDPGTSRTLIERVAAQAAEEA